MEAVTTPLLSLEERLAQLRKVVLEILKSEVFQTFAESQGIDPYSLTYVPAIPWNIDSAWAVTGRAEIQFWDPIALFHCRSLDAEDTYEYTLAIYDLDSFGVYPNMFELEPNVPSRSIAEVYPDVDEVIIGGEAIVKTEKEPEA